MKTWLCGFVLAFAGFVLAGPARHSTITYIIVPTADVDKALLDLVAQSTTNELRPSLTGDKVVLEFARYKEVLDPMPVLSTNDKVMSAKDLEYNMKLDMYDHTHKTTPLLLQKYQQYSYSEILVEMDKAEWTDKVAATNLVVVGP